MSTPRISVMQARTLLELWMPWIVLYTDVRVVPHSRATRYTDHPLSESRRLIASTGGNDSASRIASRRVFLSVSVWNLDFSKGSCRVENGFAEVRTVELSLLTLCRQGRGLFDAKKHQLGFVYAKDFSPLDGILGGDALLSCLDTRYRWGGDLEQFSEFGLGHSRASAMPEFHKWML